MDTEHIASVEPVTLHLTANHAIAVRVLLKRTHCPLGDPNQVLTDPAGGLSLVSFSTESCPFELVLAIDSDRRIRKDIVASISLHDAQHGRGHDDGHGDDHEVGHGHEHEADAPLAGGLREADGAAVTHVRFAGQKRRLQSPKFGLGRTSFRAADSAPHAMRLQIALGVDGNAPQAVLSTPAFFVLSKIPPDLLAKDYILRHLRTRAASLRFHVDTAAKRYHPSQKRATVFFHLASSYLRFPFAHMHTAGAPNQLPASLLGDVARSSSPGSKRHRPAHAHTRTPPLTLDVEADDPADIPLHAHSNQPVDSCGSESMHDTNASLAPRRMVDVPKPKHADDMFIYQHAHSNTGTENEADTDTEAETETDTASDNFEEIIHKHTCKLHMVTPNSVASSLEAISPNSSSQAAHLLLSLASTNTTSSCLLPSSSSHYVPQTAFKSGLPVLALIASASRVYPQLELHAHQGYFNSLDSDFSSPTTPFSLPPIISFSSESPSVDSLHSLQEHVLRHMV